MSSNKHDELRTCEFEIHINKGIPSIEERATCYLRRSKLEICCDILQAIYGGVDTPTRLMYRTNLTWVVLREILDGMQTNGIVSREPVGKRHILKLTPEGREVYHQLAYVTQSLSRVIDPIREHEYEFPKPLLTVG